MENEDKPYFYSPLCYTKPIGYNIPTIEELSADATHPELNTFDFRYKLELDYKKPKHFLPIFSHVDTQDGNFVVATNRFTGLIFDSTIISTSNFDTIRNADVNSANLVASAPNTSTALKLLNSNLVSNIFASLSHENNFLKGRRRKIK